MTKAEIDQILSRLLDKRSEPLDMPSVQDWEFLKRRFNTEFSSEFIDFIDLVQLYYFPAEVYDVTRNGNRSNNGTIDWVYDLEMKQSGYAVPWDADLIPFCDIGTGDYFCLSAKQGKTSPVYYIDHEDSHIEEYAPSFSNWIERLPELIED